MSEEESNGNYSFQVTWLCLRCGTKFKISSVTAYDQKGETDLSLPEIVCPVCGSSDVVEASEEDKAEDLLVANVIGTDIDEEGYACSIVTSPDEEIYRLRNHDDGSLWVPGEDMTEELAFEDEMREAVSDDWI